jgi:hypothetical protein
VDAVSDLADPSDLPPDEKILREARRRFHRCQDWESTARNRFMMDMKFCYGDAYNNYQWNAALYQSRDQANKPALTINKTHQHCLQIVNDARQNKAGIEVRPVGDGASKEAADIFEGIVRHIEYVSNAQQAYDTASWNQVVGGIGYWRLITEYSSPTTFEQEIFIRRVPNAMSVYLDPDIQEYDGSDARFGFVFRDMPKEEFDKAYPALKNSVGSDLMDDAIYTTGWADDEHVRVAEYYRAIEEKDHLVALVDGTTGHESDLPVAKMRAMAMAHLGSDDPSDAIMNDADGNPMRREVSTYKVEHFLIAGDKIADRSIWPGAYIPLIRVVGEETVIDGQMDRRGHTRALINPQQMYNFWSSSAVEQVAAQTKIPWLASMEAVGPYEQFYKVANNEDLAWLPWVAYDETGRANPKPERTEPPVMADAYLKGMQVAANEMMMVSGQYQAVMGQQSNETSGKAINARQRQGDNATYHFIDHLALAIRNTGRQLIDLIPKVYDTRRVKLIMAEDGTESSVIIDPNAPQAHQAVPTPGGAPPPAGTQPSQPDETIIFNPTIGRYDVIADVGPAYATRRQEAFNAFTQIMQASPDLMHVVGDLMFKAADFPMADDIAARLHNLVPPQALGGPSPQLAELQQQFQQMNAKSQQTIGQLVQQLAEKQLEMKRLDADQAARTLHAEGEAAEDRAAAANDDAKATLDAYRAETDRMKAIGAIDPEAFRPIIRELVSQALGTPIVPVMAAHAAAQQAREPEPQMQPAE